MKKTTLYPFPPLKWILAALLLSALNAPAVSASPSGENTSLTSQWQQQIFERQPDKAVIEAYDRLARSSREAAGNVLGNMALTLRHESDALTDDQGVRTWEGGIDLPLKVFDQRAAYDDLARRYPSLRDAHERWLRWQSAGIARALLSDLQERRIRANNAEDAETQASRLHDLVTLRERTGDASQLDLLLARRHLAQAQALTVAARADLARTVETVALWGIDLNEADLDRLAADTAEAQAVSKEMEQRIHDHPRYRWLAARNDVERARLELALWQDRPSSELYLGTINDRASGSPSDTALVIELRLPLGANPGYQSAAAQGAQQQRQLDADLARLALQLRQGIVEAQQALTKARQLLPLSRQQLEAAEKAFALSRRAYDAGDIGLQDLLIVQQQQLQARLEYALAEANVARKTRQLNQANGVFQ